MIDVLRQKMRSKMTIDYTTQQLFEEYYSSVEYWHPSKLAKLNSDLYYDNKKLLSIAKSILDSSVYDTYCADGLSIFDAVVQRKKCLEYIKLPKQYQTNFYVDNKQRLNAALKYHLLEMHIKY